jgi:ligand-binding SRPBCC domain-containing protein
LCEVSTPVIPPHINAYYVPGIKRTPLKLYKLHKKQELGITRKEAWDFFSNPSNLPLITPPWLDFNITSDVDTHMYPGMLVTYTVTPFLNFRMQWVTEITHVQEPDYFVDEQRSGPYKFWHHQHKFTQIPGGVLVEDLVHYALPFDPLTRVANKLIVKKQVEEIFEFRRQYLETKFSPPD